MREVEIRLINPICNYEAEKPEQYIVRELNKLKDEGYELLEIHYSKTNERITSAIVHIKLKSIYMAIKSNINRWLRIYDKEIDPDIVNKDMAIVKELFFGIEDISDYYEDTLTDVLRIDGNYALGIPNKYLIYTLVFIESGKKALLIANGQKRTVDSSVLFTDDNNRDELDSIIKEMHGIKEDDQENPSI